MLGRSIYRWSYWYEDVVVDYKLALDLIGNKTGIVCFRVVGVKRVCDDFINLCGNKIANHIDLNISNSVFK
jgi:hypothetical protein